MSYKTFHHLAIAIGLTAALASIKLSSQAKAFHPVSFLITETVLL